MMFLTRFGDEMTIVVVKKRLLSIPASLASRFPWILTAVYLRIVTFMLDKHRQPAQHSILMSLNSTESFSFGSLLYVGFAA